jgi:hypothetical protein
MVRKRSPGGGRKPIGPSAARAQFSVRMPDDMRAQLEAEAQKHGRTLTQEMLQRLRRSLREDDRDPAMRAMFYILSQVAEKVGSDVLDIPRRRGLLARPWTRDPFVFKAFRLAVEKVLAALEPSGELRSPYRSEAPEALGKFATPEGSAEFAADYVLHLILFGSPYTPEQMAQYRKEDGGESFANEIALDAYDMSHARKGLGLEKYSNPAEVFEGWKKIRKGD